MGELARRSETGLAMRESAGVIDTVVRFTAVTIELAIAAARLAGLSERVRQAYDYVEGCAEGVNQLADQMAGLEVDPDTIAEHRQAAVVMWGVLDLADEMASATEDLATTFANAAEGHRADYGTVNEATRVMPVPMADATFYSNR